MASDPAAPDALDTLELVVRHLGDELAFFRRRALDAERRLRDVLAAQNAGQNAAQNVRQNAAPQSGEIATPSLAADLARLSVLEAENAELRGRIAEAADRARAVASRMRFARQQDDVAAIEGGT